MLSDRIQKIGFSPTLKISAKARAMKAEGIDVIDLSVGEPDFPTPDNVKSAGKQAIDENFTKYTANDGILPLRKAIARKLKEENGLEYEPDEIIVSTGAKNCIYNFCMAVLDGGDEAARQFIERYIFPEIELAVSGELGDNYKSQLQQLVQRLHGNTPNYQLLDEQGPDHSKFFKVAAEISGELKGDVKARSLILAEKARVQGTVDAKVLVVREGAWLSGSVAAGESESAGKAAATPAPSRPIPAGNKGSDTIPPGEAKQG